MKEEKAKEYNSWRKFVSDYRIWTPALEKACKIAEKQGYKKAEQDLFTQLTAYKEALRELVGRYETLERSIAAHPDYVFGDENDEWHTFLSCGEEVLTKAKTLIE